MTSGITLLPSTTSPLLPHPLPQVRQPITLNLDELFDLTKGKSNPEEFAKLTAAKEAVVFGLKDSSAVASCNYVQEIIEHPGFVLFAKNILGERANSLITSQKDLAVKYLKNFKIMADVSQRDSSTIPTRLLELCGQDDAKVCYMPGGWQGQSGQLVIIRVHARQDSSVDVRIINRTIGSHVHNKVDGFQLMNDLSSPAFLVDLQSDSGKQLFTEWSNLLFTQSQIKDIKHCDLDFYGRLLCYGQELKEADYQGRASKNRYIGGGSASSIISMLADVFHTAGISVDDHRKFVLVVKLFALMQEFAAVDHKSFPENFFQEAIDKMMVRAAKIGPEVCDTTVITALCMSMQSEIAKRHASQVSALSTGTRMPCEGINLPKFTIKNDDSYFNEHSSSILKSVFLPPAPKSLQDFTDTLRGLQVNNTLDIIALRSYLRCVPCTSHKKFWTLTSASALELLQLVNKLVRGIKEGEGRQARQILAEVSLIALDIAALCAENIPALKFETKYTVALNVLLGHEAAFSDPDSLRTLERVKKNFSIRGKGKIALFSSKIDMEKGPEVTYLLHHIITLAELDRFFKNNGGKETEATVIQKYFVTCEGYSGTLLPGEEFSKPCKDLLSLINCFVRASQFNELHIRFAYSENGMLGSLPREQSTFAGVHRTLFTEFFGQRVQESPDELRDDRQNLIYSLVEHNYDDLTTAKVGVIYDSFRQYKEKMPFKPEVHRELCTLEASRELRSINALDWMMRSHQFLHVQDIHVRDRLETLLFGPESALHAVRHLPKQLVDALVRFQSLYQQQARLCQKQASIETLEWCSSVVDRFRYHLEVENTEPNLLQSVQTRSFLLAYLQQFSSNLSVQSQGALHRALALSHLHHSMPNPEEFIYDLIRAAYHGVVLTVPAWPLLLGVSFRLKVSPAALCKNQTMLTRLAQEILKTSDSFRWDIDPKRSTVVVGSSKDLTCTFDLYTGESFTSKGRIVDLLDQLRQNKAFSHLAEGRDSLPVAVKNQYYALSVDGTLGFRLEKENDVYVIQHPYKDLRIAVDGNRNFVRSSKLEVCIEDPRSDYKVFSLHTEFVLEELLGTSQVHTWNLDINSRGVFERLFIDAHNPQKAVLQTLKSYTSMQLEDGVWRPHGAQFSFVSSTGQPDLDDLIKRAVPISTSFNDHLSGCGFLHENGVTKKMVIPALQTSFTRCVDRNIWVYDQDKDYKLMTQKTVSALDGYEQGFVLQHIRDPKKQRFLLTPFAWKEKDGMPIADFTQLLQDRPFVCDFLGEDIVCDTATHLYLAFVFRNTRRFDLAMRELENSRHLRIDSLLEQQMVRQIAKFKIVTTPGIAFDIQFLARALEHSERFIEKSFSEHTEIKLIRELLSNLVRSYHIATSHYREGVNGIPESLVVPKWVLDGFSRVISKETSLSSVRLKDIERATLMTSKSYLLKDMESRGWYLEISASLAQKDKQERELSCSNPQIRVNKNDLALDFLQLAKWATSKKAFETGKVKSYILTYLSQHNTSHGCLLLELLIIMLNYPEQMAVHETSDNTLKCVETALSKLPSLGITKECTLFSPLLEQTKLAKPVAKPALLPEATKFAWKMPTVEYAAWPTEDLYSSNFTEFKHKPYQKTSWPIAKWKSTNKLETGLIQSLNQAFAGLKEIERSLHRPNEKIILELDGRQRSIQARIKTKQAEVERLLNQVPHAYFGQFFVLQEAQVIGKLTLAHALQAILQRSHKAILKLNPLLTENDLDAIYTCTIEYQLLCIEDKQIDEIRRVKHDIDRLAEVLFRKRCYDPVAYPEILAYAAATGKDPSPQQAAILEKIFTALSSAIDHNKIKHLLLEFAAGGGKTLVLTPILAMFLVARGKLPVICTTPELYYQSLESLPPMLKAAYGMQMELIDRDVEHQWSVTELEALKVKLESWHKHQGRPVLMKGSSWHSLNTAGKIASYMSVIQNDRDAGSMCELIRDILAYFKEHGVRIEDECQDGSDPHELTVRSFEVGAPVPMQHHDIYYQAYQIANKHQKASCTITPEIAARIKAECIEFFVHYRPFSNLSWLRKYLSTDLHAERPRELISLNQNYPALADLCILAKACIALHLPHTESLTLGKEFGASIHAGDMTAAPRHDGRPTSAHFTDNMLVTALTIQKALEVGVPEEHLEAVAQGLRDEHETALFRHERITEIEEAIGKLVQKPNFRMKSYTDKELSALLQSKIKEPWLVDRYLTRHALVQNRFRGRSCQSTPAEMALGFNISIQMSAFVGLRQLYSVLLGKKDDLLDTSFVAEVLAVLLERCTEGYIMDDRSSPTAFFAELFQKSPLDANFMEAYFDKGLFANYSAQDQLQGALAATGDLNRPGITWDNERTIIIPPATLSKKIGSNLAAFPLRQTTGRDYPELSFNARCAFLLGKKVTLSGVVQTAMRARKLLIPRAQTLFWAAMRDLWATIAPESEGFDVEKALRWSLQNFAEELSSKVLARAYQGIDAELHGVAWKLVHANDRRKENMLYVLCPKAAIRPWDIYAKEQESQEPRVALLAYSMSVMCSLGLKATEISKTVQDRIYEIIDQTEELIDDIKCSGVSTLAQFGFQNQQQEQKLNTQLQDRSRRNYGVGTKLKFESYGPINSLTSDYKLQFQDFKVAKIDAKKLPEFAIPTQVYATPRTDWKNAVKPLSHLMLVQEAQGVWKYYALTEAGARFYVQDANKVQQKVLVVAIGKTVLTSGLTQDCQEQIESARFTQVVSLLNLMFGRAFDALALVNTICALGWNREDYQAFCQYIRTITPPDESFAPEKYERELFGGKL